MTDAAQPTEPLPETQPIPVSERWHHLPEPVRPEDQVISVPASDAPDVNGGRNPDHEWMLRGL